MDSTSSLSPSHHWQLKVFFPLKTGSESLSFSLSKSAAISLISPSQNRQQVLFLFPSQTSIHTFSVLSQKNQLLSPFYLPLKWLEFHQFDWGVNLHMLKEKEKAASDNALLLVCLSSFRFNKWVELKGLLAVNAIVHPMANIFDKCTASLCPDQFEYAMRVFSIISKRLELRVFSMISKRLELASLS
ncbi:Uncharacterized protein TCM_031393 [Theobroma cacao]|uniref:Uncharacterized protein n=1 Tax=Theobroma cacao TaxID=3641 RepID=A0A061F751_THECC|nr:Uncharacterized protein TCM_031393 [Theobroma cacao]